jgi:hypothetical protein
METITHHYINSSRHIQVLAHRRSIVQRILLAQVGNHPVQRFAGGLGAGGPFFRRMFRPACSAAFSSSLLTSPLLSLSSALSSAALVSVLVVEVLSRVCSALLSSVALMLPSPSASSWLNSSSLEVCCGGGGGGVRLAVSSSWLTVPSLFLSSAEKIWLLSALLPALVRPLLSSSLLMAPSPSVSRALIRASARSVFGPGRWAAVGAPWRSFLRR